MTAPLDTFKKDSFPDEVNPAFLKPAYRCTREQ